MFLAFDVKPLTKDGRAVVRLAHCLLSSTYPKVSQSETLESPFVYVDVVVGGLDSQRDVDSKFRLAEDFIEAKELQRYKFGEFGLISNDVRLCLAECFNSHDRTTKQSPPTRFALATVQCLFDVVPKKRQSIICGR